MEQESISTARIGSFRVLRRLANGATTDVLLARADGSDRVVALKVLLQQFRSDPAFEQAFVREAAAYARLTHPAIVKLYDFFAVDGQFVMVLEYVDGLPLHKLRAMLSIGGEKVEDSAALFVAARIFEALAAAHSAVESGSGELAPVIHGDINPSNVLVPWNANVKVSDFGIAKAGGTRADTKMGFVKGTYGYLAPEQVKGQNVTARADIYAGSLLLWELLARRKAIQRGAMSESGVLQAMAMPDFPSLDVVRPDVDPLVREAVRRGLAVNPDERSITAEEMVGVLAGAMKGDEGRATLAQAIARVRPVQSDPADDQSRLRDAEAFVDRAVNGSIRPDARFSPSTAPDSADLVAPSENATLDPAVEAKAASPPPAPPLDPDPSLPPPASASGTATIPVVAVGAPRSVAGIRGKTPSRDLALVVVLLSALVGAAIVAFCLWSQEGRRPPSVVASPPSPPSRASREPASSPAVAAPSVSALPAPAPNGSAAASGSTSASAASASSPLPAPPATSPGASPRVARPAGSDREAAAAGLGDLFMAASAGGHRVFVDGRVVGESPASVRVRCGKHEVRVGGNGIAQTVDVPCGGSVIVSPKWPAPSDDRPPP